MLNHERKRYALLNLIKKLKFSPVVLIQGTRQTGKSFLVKSLLPKTGVKTKYKNLDLASVRQFAENNPDSFVRDFEEKEILIIDKAQKVPALFDSVKACVDEKRIPGQYILLGSTEFSKLSKIRESLTGRAGKIRIFPLTLSETKHLPLNEKKNFLHSNPRVNRKDFLKYLDNGGMPGMFGIKSEPDRIEALSDWISLAAERDCLSFDKIEVSSDLIKKILTLIATLEDSSAGSISKHLRTDLRKINTHLNVLKTLYIVNELPPYLTGTGKPQFFFCDVGFLNIYNASFDKKIKTFILQELTAQISYRNESGKNLYFFRTPKGRFIDFIITENEKISMAIKIIPSEMAKKKDFDILNSFKLKNKETLSSQFTMIGLTGTLEKFANNEVEVYPWECLS